MFKDLVKDLVQQAIVIVDDLADAVVYTSVVDQGTYDAASDTFVGGTTTVVNFNAVLARYSLEELDDSIVVQTDMKVVVADLDLNGVEPKEEDTMTALGNTWNVQGVKGVPGESVWILHIRQQ